MTDMKRVSISIPECIDKKIFELRRTDRFLKCSYSEIVRQVLTLGLESTEGKTPPPTNRPA